MIRSCRMSRPILATVVAIFSLFLSKTTSAFLLTNSRAFSGKLAATKTSLKLVKETSITEVEVCGFKDCRRAGGGQKLEKKVREVLEEREDLATSVLLVGICDCQGECGYGPNLLLNGKKLVNGVKTKEDILKALDLEK